jgi:hypothetical protein
VVRLDEIGALLANHVDSILDPAVWNDREHRRINDPQVLEAVHLQLSVDYALLDVLRQAAGSAGVCIRSNQ